MNELEYLKLDNRGQTSVEVILLIGSILVISIICGTYIYKNPVVGEIEKDYQETLKKCRKIDYQYYVDLPWLYRIAGHILRLFGPLV